MREVSVAVRNNFDLLRVVAGLALVYGNGQILTGASPSALWGAPFSRFGLDMLFAIGGYTTALSWRRDPRLLAFAIGRLRRMVPGLAVCVAVTIAVIGTWATTLSLHQYALNGLTFRYVQNAWFRLEMWLPGVFQGQQWAGTTNPMLWTLLPGLLCSLAVPLASLLPARFRAWGLALGIAAALAAIALPLQKGGHFYHPRHLDVLIELPFFAVGAGLAYAEARVKDLFRADLAMLFFAGNWICATWLGEINLLLEWVSLPYMLACFGRMSAPLLGTFGKWGKPGYGLYLYAFPVQQLIVAKWPGIPYPMAICGAVSLALGYLSWHLVERPALDFAAWPARRPAKLASA